MKELTPRLYAYIGDAVYEVFAREKTISLTHNPKRLHKATSSIVSGEFHAELLHSIEDFLNEDEAEVVRRARNLSVTTARRVNQSIHRLSTAFEALVGYLHLHDKKRLDELYNHITPLIDEKLSKICVPEKS